MKRPQIRSKGEKYVWINNQFIKGISQKEFGQIITRKLLQEKYHKKIITRKLLQENYYMKIITRKGYTQCIITQN